MTEYVDMTKELLKEILETGAIGIIDCGAILYLDEGQNTKDENDS